MEVGGIVLLCLKHCISRLEIETLSYGHVESCELSFLLSPLHLGEYYVVRVFGPKLHVITKQYTKYNHTPRQPNQAERD